MSDLDDTDKAIIRMRRLLLDAAKRVSAGEQAPATGPEHDYFEIRSAEKILEPDEDWRVLGTNDDPLVREMDTHGLREREPIAGS